MLFSRWPLNCCAPFQNASIRRRTFGTNVSDYSALQPRTMLALLALEDSLLAIYGTYEADQVVVSRTDSEVDVTVSGEAAGNFQAAEVGEILFIGLGGDDVFDNQSNIPSRAYGNGGDDTLIGGTRNDVLIGGLGSDTIQGRSGDDIIRGGGDRSTLNILSGGGGDDRIFGGAGDNTISAENGNDVVFGSSGDDDVNGGNGDDQLYVGAGTNNVRGGSGDDVIIGGSGVDTVFGDAGIDRIYSLGGNDVIYGGDDVDILFGGHGNDWHLGGDGNDQIRPGPGNDFANGGSGDDLIVGFRGNNTLNGGAGDDRINAGAGNDIINGGEGNDKLFGQAGDDIIEGGDGNDFIVGEAGDDEIRSGDGDDEIFGSGGDDFLDGGAGDDLIFGLLGNDSLFGSSGDDRLFGNEGGDELLGGSGEDVLYGGSGVDRARAWDDVGYRDITLSIEDLSDPFDQAVGNANNILPDGWRLKTRIENDDIWFTTVAPNGRAEFDIRFGSTGVISEIRDLDSANNLLAPPFKEELTDRVVQWTLWEVGRTVRHDVDELPDLEDRFNITQAGTFDNVLHRTVDVDLNPDEGQIDVWSIADRNWKSQQDPYMDGSVTALTRTKVLDGGGILIRRVVRIGEIKLNGRAVTLDEPFFEAWTPFSDSEFDSLALGINSSGTPNQWFADGNNIPRYRNTPVRNTRGWATSYNRDNIRGGTNMSVIFGTDKGTVHWADGRETSNHGYRLNLLDFEGGAAILPGLYPGSLSEGAVIDQHILLLPGEGINSQTPKQLDALARSLPAPQVYHAEADLRGELVVIADRLSRLASESSVATDQLASRGLRK